MEYVNRPAITEEFLCAVCANPWVDPWETPCGHVFCRGCLSPIVTTCPQCKQPVSQDQLRQPSLMLRNIADKLEVYCRNRNAEVPCDWKGARSQFAAHVTNCLSGKPKPPPTFVYANEEDATFKELQCSVCLAPFTDPVMNTPCEHVFCRACVAPLGECPQCRIKLSAESLTTTGLRPVVSLLDRLPVRCAECRFACTRSEFALHKCPKSIINLTTLTEFPSYGQHVKNTVVTLLHLQAPAQTTTTKRKPVRVSAVIDVSGSMAGEKLQLTKESLKFVIGELTHDDEFGLVAFDDNVEEVMKVTRMDQHGKAEAERFVDSLKDRGSTNLSGGLFAGINQVRLLPIDSETAARPMSSSNRRPTSASNAARPQSSMLSALSSLIPGSRKTSSPPLPPPPPPLAKNGFIAAVWLFTDGQANAGITEPTELIQATKAKLSSHPQDVSVFTFGFGSDHNASLLSGIAEASQGSYYFVKDTTTMKESFADCLGGLMSTVAQNLTFSMTCAPGITIGRVMTKYPFTQKSSELEIRLKDLYSEEKRDFLVELCVPPTAAARGVNLCRWNLSYVVAATGVAETATAATIVDVVDAVPVDQKPNIDVDTQRNRYLTAEALEKAKVEAEKGNVKGAQAVLASALNDMMATPAAATDYCAKLQKDLLEAQECTATETVYRSKGSKKMTAMWGGHVQQRCNNVDDDDLYVTSAKCAVKSKAKASK